MNIKLKDVHDFASRVMMAGYSQRSFAEIVGISNPYMNLIFNKKRDPSAKVAKKIADVLEVEFDEIFFISKDNKSYQTA